MITVNRWLDENTEKKPAASGQAVQVGGTLRAVLDVEFSVDV